MILREREGSILGACITLGAGGRLDAEPDKQKRERERHRAEPVLV